MTDDAWWRVPGHTPGPWTVERRTSPAGVLTEYAVVHLGYEIGRVSRLHENDARFAALAPRMSAEIDRLREHLFHIARGDERPADIAVAALAGKEPTP
ncbi:MAG: hypothetical protein E6R03_12420 [Hyphomicrobiaceae bacterium]|nr:MAG: hypothetical protein E6R03_12420 [Hyphomicrobiaceae bacterium]